MGRRCGCLAAILGRVLGVVTVDVVVDVPAPARQRVGAVVVGRVLVDVTGRGRLVDGVGTVLVAVTGRVLVDVTGGVLVVVAGAVPTPTTWGRLNRLCALSTLTGYEMLKSSISWSNWARSTGLVNSVTMSVMLLISKGGGAEGEPTPAGDRVGLSMQADKSVCCPPSLCRR